MTVDPTTSGVEEHPDAEALCECGHLGLFHDMMEFGQGLRCCVDGCTCGSNDHRVATSD